VTWHKPNHDSKFLKIFNSPNRSEIPNSSPTLPETYQPNYGELATIKKLNNQKTHPSAIILNPTFFPENLSIHTPPTHITPFHPSELLC